jgi:hypothetical protein
MDTAFLLGILEHDGAAPEGCSVQRLTPELLELLGSADMGRREASLDALSGGNLWTLTACLHRSCRHS